MKIHTTMLAGTALALCIVGTSALAGTVRPETAASIRYENGAGVLMLAQAEDQGAVEPQEEPRRKKRRAEARAEEPAAREPAGAEEQPRKKRRAEAERPARAEAAAGEEQPRKKRRAEARAEEPAAQEPARAEEQPRNKKRREAERRAQADAAAQEEQPRKKRRAEARAEQSAAQEPARAEEQPRKKRRADAERRAQADTPAAEEPAPAKEQPRKKRRADAEQPAQAETPSADEPTRAEEQPRKKRRTDAEQPAQAETPSVEEPARAEEQPRKKRRTDAEQPTQAETPSVEEPARAEEQPRKKRRTDAEQPAQTETPSTDEPARAEEQPRRRRGADAEQPAQAETGRPATAEPADETVRADEQKRKKNRRPRDGGKAPILDSAKQEPVDAERPRRTEAAAPPPADDRAAQAERIDRRKLARADSEKGERIDREKARERRRERPEGSDVVREIGDRVVIQLGDQIMVEDRDRGRRIRRDARDVYYEELPRGRQREIVERRDGTRIVTIRDSYGDVIRRSRFEPDGNEIILAYVDEDAFERDGYWYDPGRDLPPLELSIPVEEYILDAERAPDPETYYEFLDQPPVEKIQRYYSVDEVKRSARIRDTVRRVDLDTITFEFGSAEIAEGEVERLDNVAKAMEKLLKQNPAETFLIEGHTDAVGSDVANLALSDRRAEAVAQALTDVFEIPPENLETQGYGEEYLKVNTDGPERENRRVSIRRITPLVAPVASAE